MGGSPHDAVDTDSKIPMRILFPLMFACLSITGSGIARDETVDSAADMIRSNFPDAPMYVLGELHGTREAPALAARLVESLLSDVPVTIALEVPVNEQAAVTAFMASDDHANAVSVLLGGAFWQRPRDRSDGRRSEAMRDLFLTLRHLYKHHHPKLKVALFDPGSADARDQRMAERLAALDEGRDDDRIVVLTGNHHARRVRLERARSNGQLIAPPQRMASYLRQDRIVTIEVAARRGTFWGCSGRCGQQTLRESPGAILNPVAELKILDGDRRAYDARLWLPRYTASPPVNPDGES